MNKINLNLIEINDYICQKSITIFKKTIQEFLTLCLERNYKEVVQEKKVKEERKSKYIRYLIQFLYFKDSLKTLYQIESKNLFIDNKIDNLLEEAKKSYSDINLKVLESVILENSLEMFKDIFNKK